MRNDSSGPDFAAVMVDNLARLVACDTSLPPGENYAEICDMIESMYAPLGGTAERVEVPREFWIAEGLHGSRVNLILRPPMGAPNAPEAMIYFHTDTAAIGDGWSRPPLDLTQEGDALYGRGTADMKGTIVAVLDALLRLQGKDLAFRPVLAFCTDEEGGRHPGIRYLAETRDLPATLLNLNGSAEPRIWAGCMGSLNLAIAVEGVSAHSGEPQRGVNAIERTLPAIAALRALAATVETRTTDMPPPPGAEGPLHARLTITAIHAGSGGSAIPGRCELVVNRRYIPDEDAAEVEAEIRETLTQVLGTEGWTLDVAGHLPPVVDPSGPATERWAAARAEAFGIQRTDFVRYGSSTSSDFGWVQRAGQRHMLLGGLARPGRNVHGPDEHTTLTDLAQLSRAVELFLSADFATADRDNPTARQTGCPKATTEETHT